MRVLIVGSGIAGPTLAYWLARTGHEPTLVERAPQPRRGGYLVDFWGAGFDVAERMGIAAELHRSGHHLTEARSVDRRGRRVASFPAEAVVGDLGDRYVTIARSDLASTIMSALDGRVETLFGETVAAVDDVDGAVHVRFASGTSRDFDLVVGADGLHSAVRTLTFGAQEQFERYLGMVVAVFEVEGYAPRTEGAAVMHADVGFQLLRVSLRDDVTMFCVSLRHDDGLAAVPDGPQEQQALLRHRLAGAGWETPAVLDAMGAARTFFFDRVSQIRMPSWTRGRVALVGDAAACPSFLAGQGSALAMVEAYVLAVELARADGDHARAFARYHERLGPLLRSKQDAAVGLGLAFAPRSRAALAVRNVAMRLMGLPYVPNLVMGRSLRDAVELPAVPVA
ncbi:FAD dependent oxidoreductase [Pseudonocardia dioxanivorans CB1190]|uniref:FAD dependent oxidoreductase n=1 Tax=Pseudonocardia dioxanivorans (strain ATCC 55486 / DSM 44775 / JCM 13855 / CB1190) TaxID=675635 RepID=F4D068_PSEUX|nr:FAD-binding domain [Pseudonocardia dioxanivorans]AEA25724.1 FAD dependent oxidoreductase [Pseudonocardia dioxanivorans CB1190]